MITPEEKVKLLDPYIRGILILSHAIYDHVYNDLPDEKLISAVRDMLSAEQVEKLEHMYIYKDMYHGSNFVSNGNTYDVYDEIDTGKLNDVEEMNIVN